MKKKIFILAFCIGIVSLADAQVKDTNAVMNPDNDFEFSTQDIEKYESAAKAVDAVQSLATKGFKHKSFCGMNFMVGSNKHYYTKGYLTGKAAMSYSAGLFYRQQISSSFALQLDADYERAYANTHLNRFESNVLSVPLSLVFTTGARKYYDFTVGIGGYYDYTFSGKVNGVDIDFDNVYNQAEWGWQYSLQVRYGRFIIGYYQKLGMSDMLQDSYNHKGKVKNRNQYFTIGIRL